MPESTVSSRLFDLLPHSQCIVSPQWRVRVTLSVDDSGWQLRYQLPVSGLHLPATSAPNRCDELWRHSCAELFVASTRCGGYREFNFAPSGAWAVYDFDDYRCRAAQQPDVPTPLIQCATDAHLTVIVRLPAAALPEWPMASLRLGLTTVLEADDGTLSYWALNHPATTPDFHHHDGFTATFA